VPAIQLADLRCTFPRFLDRIGVRSAGSSLAKGTFTIEKNGEVIATGANLIADAEFIADEIEYKPTVRVVSDDGPEPGFEDDIPELPPEILVKTFASIKQHGLM